MNKIKVIFNEKENTILDAASDLIIKQGYDKTSVAEIAKEAGIGKGSIYLSFESKEQLLESMFMREIYRHNMKWFDLVEKDPKGGLLSGMYINQLKALVTSKLMVAIFRKDDNIFGSYLKKKNNFFKQNSSSTIGKEFVSMMQEVNCIRKDVDPIVTAHIIDMIGYSLVSIVDIKRVEDIPDIDKVFGGLATMMDRAFTPDDGGDSKAGKQVLRSIFDQAKKMYLESESESEIKND